MYIEAKENLAGAGACGVLRPTDRAISTLAPARAYESPWGLYSGYLNKLMIEFNESIAKHRDVSKITSFNHYVKHFMIYFAIISLWVVHKLINHKHEEEEFSITTDGFENAHVRYRRIAF